VTIVNKIEGNIKGLAGVEVDLILQSTQTCVDSTHSKKHGNWEFPRPPTGKYDVQFRGRGTTRDDWIFGLEIVDMTEFEAELPIIFAGTPVLNVSEGASGEDIPDVDFDKTEYSTAILALTVLGTSQGKIRKVTSYYRKNGETNYKLLDTYDFDPELPEVQSDESAATYKSLIKLRDKPTNFDFKAIFMNPNGEVAESGGSPVEVTDLNVTFNGVSDLSEYAAVSGLKMVNADDQDGSPTGYLMAGDKAILEWDDIKEKARNQFPFSTTDALGNGVSVSYQQSRKVSAYVVYMFVSDSGSAPEHEYPGTSDANGTWYFMLETKKNYASIPIITGSSFGFWVGFRTESTSTSVPKYTKEL